MSQAEELLDSLVRDEAIDYTSNEPHIVVNPDRTITVPDELKSIAVQYDNNVETVTFDCPRYWDEHDFSTMNIYITYKRPDGHVGRCEVKNLCVDDTDDSMIHFDWTISNDVTLVSGKISFLICIKNLKTDVRPHWNSRQSQDLNIEPGMEIYEDVSEQNPDAIEEILARLDDIQDGTLTLIDQNTGTKYTLYIVDGKLLMNESEG